MESFENLSWPAIILAAVSAFILGGLWYSVIFAKRWMKETGVTGGSVGRKEMIRIFGLAFILSLIAAFFLAIFIGPDAGGSFGAVAGFMAGFGWVFTYFGISYLFERRSVAIFLINAGYSVISLALMGLIIGAMQ